MVAGAQALGPYPTAFPDRQHRTESEVQQLNTNRYSHGMWVLQVAPLLAMSQCWPLQFDIVPSSLTLLCVDSGIHGVIESHPGKSVQLLSGFLLVQQLEEEGNKNCSMRSTFPEISIVNELLNEHFY